VPILSTFCVNDWWISWLIDWLIDWPNLFVLLCRPELRALPADLRVRRHIMPSTSTPVGSRVQPVVALNRGATFSGYDGKQRSSARGQVETAGFGNGCQSPVDSRKRLHCANTTDNCSVIQFSPEKQHCSTPAGCGHRVPGTAAGFLLRSDIVSDASFCNKSQCSTRVSRHASIGFDDRPRKPEKSSSSFLSGPGLGFLQKLSRGSSHSASPDISCSADVSTASVRRRSSFRDSFKKIFLSRRFGWNIVSELAHPSLSHSDNSVKSWHHWPSYWKILTQSYDSLRIYVQYTLIVRQIYDIMTIVQILLTL